MAIREHTLKTVSSEISVVRTPTKNLLASNRRSDILNESSRPKFSFSSSINRKMSRDLSDSSAASRIREILPHKGRFAYRTTFFPVTLPFQPRIHRTARSGSDYAPWKSLRKQSQQRTCPVILLATNRTVRLSLQKGRKYGTLYQATLRSNM